jgi:signal peptidase I
VYGIRIPLFEKKILALTNPQRGDIIIFSSPQEPSKDLIKRVVAVEEDLIEEKNKQIFINGKPLDEPYVQHTDHSCSFHTKLHLGIEFLRFDAYINVKVV